MAQILIVEDDPQLRRSFDKLLAQEGHAVTGVPTGEAGIEAVRATRFDLAIMDVRLPGMTGLEAFKVMRGIDSDLPVIIMTAFGTTDTAIEATKDGAYDYIIKPFDIPDMLALIGRALAAGRPRPGAPRGLDEGPSQLLVGRSRAIQELCKNIGRVAPTDALVLIRGESGTGKELVARAIHMHSRRASGPYQVINCVAIPETLLESELFGYEKGAFTGADARRIGKIELANHGTVFLDEIGDMPLSIQAKLLRLLESRTVDRLGGRNSIPVDVRVVAATNRDLEQAIRDGAFREDLYYRLNVVTLSLPPLRNREGDVELLAEHFLVHFARELGVAAPELTPEARRRLAAYSWPGNVRELGNVMHKALIFCRGHSLTGADIAKALGEEPQAGAPQASGETELAGQTEAAVRAWIRGQLVAGGENLHESLMDRFGSLILAECLALTGGNRTQAAKLLGLSRPTVISKIEKYGLRVETKVS